MTFNMKSLQICLYRGLDPLAIFNLYTLVLNIERRAYSIEVKMANGFKPKSVLGIGLGQMFSAQSQFGQARHKSIGPWVELGLKQSLESANKPKISSTSHLSALMVSVHIFLVYFIYLVQSVPIEKCQREI